jgi:hypothetical protein
MYFFFAEPLQHLLHKGSKSVISVTGLDIDRFLILLVPFTSFSYSWCRSGEFLYSEVLF